MIEPRELPVGVLTSLLADDVVAVAQAMNWQIQPGLCGKFTLDFLMTNQQKPQNEYLWLSLGKFTGRVMPHMS